MARHARSRRSEEHLTASQRRTLARRSKAQSRRLQERQQVSGEIRTPPQITARRARRSDRPPPTGPTLSKRTPVSARALVPERTFSGRMIVLTIVALVVISFLVPTVRTYLHQQAEVTELTEQIAAEEQRQADLYSTLQRWDDPDFVRQQARERINLVMPEERRYHVMGDLDDADVESVSDELTEDEPDWTDQLWESVLESADQ